MFQEEELIKTFKLDSTPVSSTAVRMCKALVKDGEEYEGYRRRPLTRLLSALGVTTVAVRTADAFKPCSELARQILSDENAKESSFLRLQNLIREVSLRVSDYPLAFISLYSHLDTTYEYRLGLPESK